MASWRPRKKAWSALALVLLLEATDLAVRPFFYLLFQQPPDWNCWETVCSGFVRCTDGWLRKLDVATSAAARVLVSREPP